MLARLFPVRGKGKEGKGKKEDVRKQKRERTVLQMIESGSFLWSYWATSNHVFILRPVTIVREMKSSMEVLS